jgi:hypothetical protein
MPTIPVTDTKGATHHIEKGDIININTGTIVAKGPVGKDGSRPCDIVGPSVTTIHGKIDVSPEEANRVIKELVP